ncbi:C4-dicarboxylate ABC transporter [Pokkaliibacter plantistimulans]|uniref:C4-dicarboxylate ABC transporter n=1 Tax=Pokkaliibacter plantistimulans TaxID=1635171 RepID=A0ABX5LR97_9GAMM|nr:sialic acid TRAP transporter substrate-binding protein SiaP [Pokkaliibacter plantistimulans]PXF28727.1 C4-dicarboxylate ABC transporter [Pokkaliibacter plantistimulans]
MHNKALSILSGIILGAAAISLSTTAIADPLKIRISSPAVETDWHARMLTVFKDELEKTSPGQFDVNIFLNASLFKQGTEPAAMQRGNLDMAMISAQDISKQIPEWSVFTAGYLIRSPEHQQHVFNSPLGQQFYKMVEEKMHIKILDVGYLGSRELNLRDDKEIRTPADLAGEKLRMPGSKEWQFLGQALGANPVPLAFGEVYTALQTGAVDGQDNPLPTVQAAKFYEVTKQIVLTNHLVDAIFLSMSMKTYDKLTDEQKQHVQEAAAKAVAFNNAGRIADEQKLVQFFRDQGLKVYEPDVNAFRQHVQEMYKSSEIAKSWPAGVVDQINAIQ